MLRYVDTGYTPTEDDLIAEYYIGSSMPLEEASEWLAAESSIGTWTDLSTMKERIVKLKPHVFYLNRDESTIKVAYPGDLFERGNMPQILSSIAGNIFGLRAIENLRFLDIRFPDKIVESFKGPRFGIQGIRKILEVDKRPIIGTIIKPKLGLNEKEHAEVAYEAWVGGVDIVKDDENLSDMVFNRFEKRIEETLKLRDKAEERTGEKKIYMPNITAETNEMIRRAEFVEQTGGEYVMIDILTAGWAALQSFRNLDLNLVIHAHRAGHAAVTRNERHGISMLPIAKISRVIGVDQLHIGTFGVGKMMGGPEDDLRYQEALTGELSGLEPVFPVASGGLHPGLYGMLCEIAGKDIIIQAGGGIHGHPGGTMSGARAARQAVDAIMEGVPLAEYAKSHRELGEALEKWGEGRR